MKQKLVIFALVSALAQPFASQADDTADQLSDLKKQVQELSQKLQDLEQKEGVVENHEKNAPLISAGANGFTFQSADTNFAINLHGVLQVDSRTFWSDDHVKGNDAFLIRRARPILSGTVFKDYDYMF